MRIIESIRKDFTTMTWVLIPVAIALMSLPMMAPACTRREI